MAPRANLLIDQGSDYIQDIIVTDTSNNALDLSGYTGMAQIRKAYSSTNAISFSVATTSNGTVQISMSSSNTNLLTPGQYVWDCELTEISSGIVTRIVEGNVTVTPSVTR